MLYLEIYSKYNLQIIYLGDAFPCKTTEEKHDIFRWKRGSFSSEVEITRNRLNKDIRKRI